MHDNLKRDMFRNLQTVNSLYFLGGLVMCLMLMIQVKQIYNNKLKNHRYLGYKQFMNEISEKMSVVEKSVNESSSYIHRLNEALLKQNDRRLRNTTQTRPTFAW